MRNSLKFVTSQLSMSVLIIVVLLNPVYAQETGLKMTESNSTIPSHSQSLQNYVDTKYFGNTHRHYLNFFDFNSHNDLTIEQVKAMRDIRIVQLDYAIQNLTSSSFAGTIHTADDSKSILHQNIVDIRNSIQNDEFYDAMSKLQSMREKMDGSIGGNLSDDLITDPSAQKEILLMVDGIIHTTTLTAQPSYGVSQKISPPITGGQPSLQFYDYLISWFSNISSFSSSEALSGMAATILIVISVILGVYKAFMYRSYVKRRSRKTDKPIG